MRGRFRLVARIIVALASIAMLLATPEAHSSPCQKLWVWNPAINECMPPPPSTPSWATQDLRPVWDPGHQAWRIWMGPVWVPL